MNIHSILLFTSAEHATADRGACHYAVSMARNLHAKLTLFVADLDVTTPGRQFDPVSAAAAVRVAAIDAGVDCTIITDHTHAIGIHEVIAEHARLHDLTVSGCHGGAILSEQIIAEHVLFDSGRPLLIVPHDHRAAFDTSKSVVAWDNTPAAARAFGDARSLLSLGEAILLTIDGDKQLRGDLDPEELIVALARRGIQVRLANAHRGDRPIAVALQEEAMSIGCDLLVMGGYGHSRLRRFVLGSATSEILKGPSLPVMLSH